MLISNLDNFSELSSNELIDWDSRNLILNVRKLHEDWKTPPETNLDKKNQKFVRK